jgi:hypothetical protein
MGRPFIEIEHPAGVPHIQMFKLGPYPPELIAQGKLSEHYFNPDGQDPISLLSSRLVNLLYRYP